MESEIQIENLMVSSRPHIHFAIREDKNMDGCRDFRSAPARSAERGRAAKRRALRGSTPSEKADKIGGVRVCRALRLGSMQPAVQLAAELAVQLAVHSHESWAHNSTNACALTSLHVSRGSAAQPAQRVLPSAPHSSSKHFTAALNLFVPAPRPPGRESAPVRGMLLFCTSSRGEWFPMPISPGENIS